MTIAMAATPEKTRPLASAAKGTKQNTLLALILLIIATLAPISLGANGPGAWLFNAALVSITGLTYMGWQILTRTQLRVGLGRLLPETCLGLVILAYMLLQMAPARLWNGAFAVIDVEGNSYALSQITLSVGQTAYSTLCYATYAIFFLLVLQVAANRHRALKLAELALAAVVAHAIWGVLALTIGNDVLLIFEKWAYKGVATGTFINRNSYGTFLAIGFVLGIGLTLRAALNRRSERGQRLPRADEKFVLVSLRAIGTVLILAALLASQSRMGLGAAISGSLVVVAIALVKVGSSRQRLTAFIGMATIVAAGIAFLIYGAGTLERLGSVESDADVRQQLYAQVMQMISNHWIWGTGAGTFELAYPLYHRWPVSPDLIWDKAHNTYLTMWSELGLIFGSIPVLIFTFLFIRLCRQIAKRQDDWWLPTISLAAIVVIAVHSLVDFSMEIQGVVFVLLLTVGIGLDVSGRKPPTGANGGGLN